MFKLLTKKADIFSIPLYVFLLFLAVIYFNLFNFNTLNIISSIIIFCGISLGYFLFVSIGLNSDMHLPLFLYTFFVVGLFPARMDIGIATALLCNSLILFLLTNVNEDLRDNSYLLVGVLLCVEYLLLPTTWTMAVFVIIHIIANSKQIFMNILRMIYGCAIIFISYFGIMYLLDYHGFNKAYLPYFSMKISQNYYPLYYLAPIAVMILHSIADHFKHYNEKNPVNRFKYTFLLAFSSAQFATIALYMGKNYEYLLLLALPASIILSRFLMFRYKYVWREIGLWCIIISLILFKLGTIYDMNFFNI